MSWRFQVLLACTALLVLLVFGLLYFNASRSKSMSPADIDDASVPTPVLNEETPTPEPSPIPTPVAHPTPGPMTSSTSKYGFIVGYPANWTFTSNIDSYPTLQEARRANGTHFQIYSYNPADVITLGLNPGAPVPKTELKVDAFIYDNMTKGLDEWVKSITQAEPGMPPITVLRQEDIAVGKMSGKKVLTTSDKSPEGSAMAVYYVDGRRGVRFIGYPADTVYADEFERIVGSFRFTATRPITYGPPVKDAWAEVMDTDECLNVRESPNISAEIARCLPDGTFVYIEDGPKEADGHRWWKLRSYGGWAAGDYLKREQE